MANIWPPELPQRVERGFSTSIGLNIIRTPMDQGVPKQRRRSNKAETMSVSFQMTDTQVARLYTFVTSDIAGISRFDFPYPTNSATTTVKSVRIVPTSEGALYTKTYRTPGYWGISLQLEVLP